MAESKLGSLGKSLKVPMVQELVKENLVGIPSRYIRRDLDHHHHHHHHHTLSSSLQIPVIDMHNLFHQESVDSELDKLHNACKQWGFFQLINHRVESAVVENMKAEVKGFFDMAIEEKMKLSQEEGEVEGYGQLFVLSEEQKLDWADLFYMITLPTSIRNPNLIAKLPPSFRAAIEAYSREVEVVAVKILKAITKTLGMKAEEMEAVFGGAMQSMRMTYYPPCPQPELAIGLSPHSDVSTITILLQVNDTDGLQIRKDGAWIPVSPLPDAFIVNIGDALEIVSNGAYRSIEHRACVNGDRERMSVATFVHPKVDGEVGPAASLVGPETPAKFGRIGAAEYLKGIFFQGA
uniref:Oxoglutarate-dependent dioxygenase 3 n=1 Tax=Ocimum basilicum TaxID=39350 RepID=A0A0B6C6R4_OCIBA|nr:oxoglutarate-dependent dioxygenase 3 [Ocimum basilicum]